MPCAVTNLIHERIVMQLQEIETNIFHLESDYSDEHVSYKAGYYHIDETEDLCGPFTTLEACRIALRSLYNLLQQEKD